MKLVKIGKKLSGKFTEIFSATNALFVNEKIGFYEPCEISDWVKNPKNNILYGVERRGKLIGFCFAKIMSPHWALIDTFYIKPDSRMCGAGRMLQTGIEAILKKRGIKYISRVTRSDNSGMHKFLEKSGYSKRDNYTWFDKFL